MKIVNKLPDLDKPIWFGLPENVDRSWQRNTSSFIISQLKGLFYFFFLIALVVVNWNYGSSL